MKTAETVSMQPPAPSRVWGVPFCPLTFAQTIEYVDSLIAQREPSYFVTANLNTVMIAQNSPALRAAAEDAAFVVADGVTLVWASSWKGRKLPERVTGADLIYGLSQLLASRGQGIFLLGGSAGVAEAAAARLTTLYPGLQVVGTASPPHWPLTPQEEDDLIHSIQAAHPDLLFVALGQPKGEIWLHERYKELGVPVSVQVGAALDFTAGRVRRAPLWVQRICMETPYRILQEPRRLAPRYFRNALFLIRMTAQDVWGVLQKWVHRRHLPPAGPHSC